MQINPHSSPFELFNVQRGLPRLRVSSRIGRLCQVLVAKALDIEPESVRLTQCVRNPSGQFLKAWGHVHGQRIFAKIYLTNTFPSVPRFEMPWQDEVLRTESARPIEEHLKIEWNMFQVMRELAGHNGVSRRLGMSLPARTIVWEEAPGYGVDKLTDRTRLQDPKGRTLAPAFFKAGAWLARVHQASLQGHRSLELGEVRANILELVQKRGLMESPYGRTALWIADESLRAVGQDQVEIPFVLTHGDYCTANLLWDSDEQKLSVIDFEHCGYRLTCHDVISFLFALRVHLLNPWVPKEAIDTLEESFWWGYGTTPRPLYMFVNAIASAMVLYHYLPRVSTRRERRGWWAGLETSVYQAFFESKMVTERLGIPEELWNEFKTMKSSLKA